MAKHVGAEERRRKVAAWRASGLSAAEYARRGGFSTTSLSRWARLSERDVQARSAPQFVRLEVASSRTPPEGRGAELAVEVGTARVVVTRGFDAELLRAVVEALSGQARA